MAEASSSEDWLLMSVCALLVGVFMSASAVSLLAQDEQLALDSQPPLEAQPSEEALPTQVEHPDQIAKKENPPEPEGHGTRLRWQDIPRNVLHDQKAIFTSPIHINRENVKWWILFGAATGALIATDQRVSNNLPQTTHLTGPSTWASRIGADYTLFPMWSVFYLAGKAGNNPRARDTGRIGIEALADAEITVNVLKLVTQRPRPEIKGQSLAFFTGGDAFPSGHSIQSWALARVVAREYSDQKWVPILAYGLASTVGVARWGGRRHSPSDVVVGSAMGFFIGDFVYRHHHAPSEKSKPLAWLATHVDFSFNMR